MIIRDLPNAEYHARPEISKSDLEKARRTMAHLEAHKRAIGLRKETPAMFAGSAFHTFVIEPSQYDKLYAVAPDFGDCRKPDNRKARDEWREANAGKRQITFDQSEMLRGMAESLRQHRGARKLLEAVNERELTVIVENEGVQCRSRLDLLSGRTILDLKSTEDASDYEFGNSISKFRYYVQGAFYLDNARLAGIDVADFVLVAVEKDPPYCVNALRLDQPSINRGRIEYKEQLKLIRECIEYDSWPAYGQDIKEISAAAWTFKRPLAA